MSTAGLRGRGRSACLLIHSVGTLQRGHIRLRHRCRRRVHAHGTAAAAVSRVARRLRCLQRTSSTPSTPARLQEPCRGRDFVECGTRLFIDGEHFIEQPDQWLREGDRFFVHLEDTLRGRFFFFLRETRRKGICFVWPIYGP